MSRRVLTPDVNESRRKAFEAMDGDLIDAMVSALHRIEASGINLGPEWRKVSAKRKAIKDRRPKRPEVKNRSS